MSANVENAGITSWISSLILACVCLVAAEPAPAQDETLLLEDPLNSLFQPVVIVDRIEYRIDGGVLEIWGPNSDANFLTLIWTVPAAGYENIRAEFTYQRGGTAAEWEWSDFIQMRTFDASNITIEESARYREAPPVEWTVRSSGSDFTEASRLPSDAFRVGFIARTTQRFEVFRIDSFRIFGTPIPCVADLNGDDLLDLFDLTLFVLAFQTDDPTADINGDGLLDLVDVVNFVEVFTGGCP